MGREVHWYSNLTEEESYRKTNYGKRSGGWRGDSPGSFILYWDPNPHIFWGLFLLFIALYSSLLLFSMSHILALHFLFTVMDSSQISALGRGIPTLILWYFRWLGSEIGQRCTEFGTIRGIPRVALQDWLVELHPPLHIAILTHNQLLFVWKDWLLCCVLTGMSFRLCVHECVHVSEIG